VCGLTGFLLRRAPAFDPATALDRMTDTLVHRGPDARGTRWLPEAGLGLGHRRLSIQDLSPLGAQPMDSASGRFTIVFNGEIYNFGALRAQLEPLGHGFRGHSDTEVMLAAFEAWGVRDAVPRMSGMFAFALWDHAERCLWLARDRLGEKPLYYGLLGGALVFGSELKALRAFPAFDGRVDRGALALYLRHDYLPGPHCIYEGCAKLPPAHLLRIDGTATLDALPEPEPYWRPERDDAARVPLGLEAATDRLEAILDEVITEQMVSDVPVGAFLSGGIDSSTIVALMQKVSPRPVRTFTVGFADPRYDEARAAARVAEHLRTEHTEVTVEADHVLDWLPRMAEVYDEPFADSSQLPTTLLCGLIREHVTVALSGDGGDETFAGYPHYERTLTAWRKQRNGSPRAALERSLLGLPDVAAAPVVRALLPEHRRLPAPLLADKLERERALRRLDDLSAFFRERLSHWSRPSLLLADPPPEPGYGLTDPAPSHLRELELLQWRDLRCYLPDDILVKVDRAAMVHSLETRIPLLDHRVVEFARGLPDELKLHQGHGKRVLRNLLYRHVPGELVDRPKQGFAAPVAEWLRAGLRDWAEALLTREALTASGVWNVDRVRMVWDEHQRGRTDQSFRLWGILMFQQWHQAASGSGVP
jgi:asparagine synthase (glutamine-hydrolysing)